MELVVDLSDPRRSEPPYLLDERAMLEAWLEFHRATMLLKCEGLDDAARKARPIASSLLSLHGLLRHMAEVERIWFRRVLLRDPDAPELWVTPIAPEADFMPLTDASWETDLNAWLQECDDSRRAAARFDLGHTGVRHGEACSLRWIYVHMIEEYARHNGHADLIRELIDGAVGW